MTDHTNPPMRYGRCWAAFAAILMCSALPARGQSLIQDVPKQYPAAFRAYQRIVPAPFRRADWVYHLNAKTDDLEILTIGEKRYVFGIGCEPGDCPNHLAIIAALDGSRAAQPTC